MNLQKPYRFSIYFALVALFLVFCSGNSLGNATDKNALDWANALEEQYSKITSIEADFDQVIKHMESNITEERTGILKFQKPLLLYWTTLATTEEIIVINDKAIWQYMPEDELVYKFSPELQVEENPLFSLITGADNLQKNFSITLLEQDKDLIHLSLLPNNPSQNLVEASIWIDKNANFIRKVSVLDFYGNENNISFKNEKLNKKIAKKYFQFSVPKGVDIEDFTKNN